MKVGLVEISDGKVRYRPEYRLWIEGMYTGRRYAMDCWETLHTALNAREWEGKNDQEFSISESELAEYFGKYVSEFNRVRETIK